MARDAKGDTNPTVLGMYAVFVLVAAGLVYSFVTVAREGEARRRCSATCMLKPQYAGADRTAPGFDLVDMDGQHVTLDQFKGKVVILNFWTKTCGPCLEEMPELAELTKILEPRKDVAVLAVSTDEGPDDVRDTLKAVVKDDHPPFRILFDPDSKIVAGKYGTRLFPETWIIDRRGVIRARFDGAKQWSDPAIVELVDQIRNGGYCPIEIKDGKTSGEGAAVCADVPSGS